MKILNYKKFLESYTIDEKDPPELNTQKIDSNNLQLWISEYNSKKGVIDSIYSTYIDNNDLITKLKSGKFIEDNGSFINPLLGLRSQIAKKNREILVVQKNIKITENDIKSKQDLIRSDPTLKESISGDIANLNKKSTDYKSKISSLSKDIIDLEKSINEKLLEFKKSLVDLENNLNKK